MVMKRIVIFMALCALALSVKANNIRFFTLPQATRVVAALSVQPELMVYCGYQNELATYVILSDVWYEAINSKYYELWIFGYDAYTGEEIYMPVDLSCVWLNEGHNMYSAADYLRFRNSRTRPSFAWSMPRYNTFVRVVHAPGYTRTYHYEIHQYGWVPPAYPAPGAPHLTMHPYYMRHPGHMPPHPDRPYTPGIDRPSYTGKYNGFSGHEYIGSGSGDTRPTGRISTNNDANRNGGGRGEVNTNGNGRGGNNGGATIKSGNSSRGSSTGGTVNTGNSSRGNSSTGGTVNTGSSSRGTGSTNTNNGGTTTRSSSTTTAPATTTTRASSSTTTTSSTSRSTSRVNTQNTSATRGTTTSTGSSRRGTVNTGSSSSRSTGTATTTTATTTRSTVNTGSSSSRSGSATTTTTTNTNARQGRR